MRMPERRDRTSFPSAMALILLLIAMSACDVEQRTHAASQPSASASTSLNSQDREFLERAAQGNNAETAIGGLVEGRAARAEIAEFGRRMVADHGAANMKLAAIARALSIALPSSLGDHQAGFDRLASRKGDDFDDEFAEVMVGDHHDAVRLYRSEAEHGTNAVLREYAASILPRIEAHLEDAKALKRRVLRVCADPNNLPFSNARLEGFENRIADLVARDLHARVEYTWWAQRRGFVRNTLRAGKCDLILGIPSSFELAQATRPYYRSSYVFVWRSDRRYRIESFDDPVLRDLKIGVHLVGDDGANTPPAHALANRGMVKNVRGYTLYGDYRKESPPSRLIEAVANGEVDVAVAWGPLAGFYAKRQNVALTIAPVSPQIDLPFLPFVFDIAFGVRRGDAAFRNELDAVLQRRDAEIARILDEYGVPRV
jgi:mxaJ protein